MTRWGSESVQALKGEIKQRGVDIGEQVLPKLELRTGSQDLCCQSLHLQPVSATAIRSAKVIGNHCESPRSIQ
jgi:hypothetical protein